MHSAIVSKELNNEWSSREKLEEKEDGVGMGGGMGVP